MDTEYTFDGISELALLQLQNVLEDIMLHSEDVPAWVGVMHSALIADAERKERGDNSDISDIPF